MPTYLLGLARAASRTDSRGLALPQAAPQRQPPAAQRHVQAARLVQAGQRGEADQRPGHAHLVHLTRGLPRAAWQPLRLLCQQLVAHIKLYVDLQW